MLSDALASDTHLYLRFEDSNDHDVTVYMIKFCPVLLTLILYQTQVFSDEFEQDGRTFEDGADPRWTAIDKNDCKNERLFSLVAFVYPFPNCISNIYFTYMYSSPHT